jgi:hypothetical protein
MQACPVALRRLAPWALDASLHHRLHDCGARQAFLTPAEYEERLALVACAQQRTSERLEARVALDRLRTALPDPRREAMIRRVGNRGASCQLPAQRHVDGVEVDHILPSCGKSRTSLCH